MRILKVGDKFPDGNHGPTLLRAGLAGCSVCGTIQKWDNGKGWLKYTDDLGFAAFACPACSGNDADQPMLFEEAQG